MTCLDENTVLELLERRLEPSRRKAVHAHLDACNACRELVAGAAGVLSEAVPVEDNDDDELTMWLERSDDADVEAPMLEPGTMVDHYRIVRRLGSGGMGQVYLGLDTLLERKVALKMVHPSLIERERALDRFLVEARTTAKLSHPNIVTIHAVGQHGGRPYVALELLAGQTLRERLRHGTLPPVEAMRVMLAVARALDAAHAAGVCHRDLKPGNVMLGIDSRVCVLDFGLAKVMDREGLETTWVGGAPSASVSLAATSTMVGGTPAYMAPEQWHGESQNASDVWALGVMLFEACTGRRPFDAPRGVGRPQRLLELVRQVTSSKAAPKLVGPAPLAELTARCLQKEPSARPSAAQIAEALWAMLAVETPKVESTVRRRRWLAPVLAACAVLAGGAMALALRPPPEEATSFTPHFDTATTPAPTPRPTARTVPSAPATSASAPRPAPGTPWDPLSYR